MAYPAIQMTFKHNIPHEIFTFFYNSTVFIFPKR
jgi:hypothetical protein